MNKKFTQVTQFLKDKTRECVVVLAGISFTLFSQNDAVAALSNDAPQVITQNMEIVESTAGVSAIDINFPSPDNAFEIKLSPNLPDSEGLLDSAFHAFELRSLEDVREFVSPFRKIAREMKKVKMQKVSVDGNANTGSLHVAIVLADGVLVSINKRIDTEPDDVVGFNLMRGRDLLISNVLPLNTLAKYLVDVQKRLY